MISPTPAPQVIEENKVPQPNSIEKTASSEKVQKPLNWSQLWRLWKCMSKYQFNFLGGVGLSILIVACEMAAPRITQRIVDVGIPSNLLSVVLQLGLLWAGVMGVSLILEAIQIRLTQTAGERVINDLRISMFEHLQTLSMSFFDHMKLGQILTRPTNDLDAVRGFVVKGINTLLVSVLTMIGAGMMLWMTDAVLFLSVFWLIIVLLIIDVQYRKRMGSHQQVVRSGFAQLASFLTENITAIRTVTAFNRQSTNLSNFNELQQGNTLNNLRAANLTGLYQPSLSLIRFTGQAILLCYGAGQVAAGRLTTGEVLAAFLYWELLMRPTPVLGTFYTTLMTTLASSERIFSLLDTEPAIQCDPKAKKIDIHSGEIRINDVTFGYEPDIPIVHDLNLVIKPGQTVAIVGPTGSGKSTILSMLARFYPHQEGKISIDGQEINQVALNSLQTQIGIVLQTNYLFSGTVLDNIRYVKPTTTEEDVYEVTTKLGVHDLLLNLPNGYLTEVGERGGSISLGMRQLICFARVLLVNPKIFLLDEATSNIDPTTESIIQQALKELCQGRTTIIVAHRLSTITHADQIVVLKRGRIAEVGKHEELLLNRGVYARLYKKYMSNRNE